MSGLKTAFQASALKKTKKRRGDLTKMYLGLYSFMPCPICHVIW